MKKGKQIIKLCSSFWQSEAKYWWGSENFFGEMKQPVGEMKQLVGEMKQFFGEMKQILWGNEAKWWGNEAKSVGEMPHRQSEITPSSSPSPSPSWWCHQTRSSPATSGEIFVWPEREGRSKDGHRCLCQVGQQISSTGWVYSTASPHKDISKAYRSIGFYIFRCFLTAG